MINAPRYEQIRLLSHYCAIATLALLSSGPTTLMHMDGHAAYSWSEPMAVRVGTGLGRREPTLDRTNRTATSAADDPPGVLGLLGPAAIGPASG